MDLSETNLQERIKRLEDREFQAPGSPPQNSFEEPPRTVQVAEEDDLPAPSNGRHLLEDNRVYKFIAEVQSPAALDLGENCHLTVENLNRDRFVYGGGDAAIYGRDVALSMTEFVTIAPGGDFLDVQADNSTEFYAETGNFIGAGLGTIDGFRVPSFQSWNFGSFGSGFRLDGSPAKVVFTKCPFRGVTETGVSALTCASTFGGEVLKMVGCYFAENQPDTASITVEAGGKPTGYIKYIDVDHAVDVDPDTVFQGFSKNDPGVVLTDSYPIADTSISGELDIDGFSAVAGSGTGQAEIAAPNVTQPFTLWNPDKTQQNAVGGRLEYIGKRERNLDVRVQAGIQGANTEVAIWVGHGEQGAVPTPVARSRRPFYLANASEPMTTASETTIAAKQGDLFSIFIENVDGNSDLNVDTSMVKVVPT